MKLGAFWWKKLGEKKLYNSTVRWSALLGISFFGTAGAVLLGLLSLIGTVERYRLSTSNVKSVYHWIFIFTVIFCLLGIAYLTSAGFVFARALIITFFFRKIFGFMPPTTLEGVKTLQGAVDNYIRGKAKWLNEVYKKEQSLQEEMRLFRTCGESCDTSEELERLVKTVSSREALIKKYRSMIPEARKGFYKAYNTARSKYLPVPFEVRGFKASFKDYLPKNVAA